jgi:hypothetical protein
MSNDFATTYDNVLPAQTETAISSITYQTQRSDAILLNSVLEGGPIPYIATAAEKSTFSKKAWKQIRTQVASIL